MRPPSQSYSFKNKDDDIGAAMAAVQRAMKGKKLARETMEANFPIEALQHLESEEGVVQLQKEVKRKRALESKEAALITAMRSRDLAVLRKAIDDAATLGIPGAIVDEARALLRLECRLQTAVAEGDLSDIRTAVSEVHRCRALSAFPLEPPFAVHQPLEYWSESKGDWIRCRVINKSADGKILISLKKKADHWYSLNAQRDKFRLVDMGIAAAALQVNLDAASALLRKSDELQAALESKDVSVIKAAVALAQHTKSLSGLVRKAEMFLQEASRRRSADEAEPVDVSCDVAMAWQAAKKSIRHALRTESDRAWTEAACKGWDNLERDLAVESLAALEKSFDIPDLGSLELSIKKLGNVDLDISVAVVEEARLAWKALSDQRVQLHNAMKDGDIETMRTAIKFAKHLLLPEALVGKATAALEVAVAIATATESQDPSQLASTLARLEHEGTEPALLQKVRGIVSANKALEGALCGKDMDSIEKAMCAALDEGASRTLVDQARWVLVQDRLEKKRREESGEKERQILAAMHDGDIYALRAVLELIHKEHFLPDELTAKARAMVEIGAAIEAAIKTQDQDALASTVSRAELEGFEMPLVQKARLIVHASEALRAAMQNNDIDAIEESICMAEVAGVSIALVAQARQVFGEEIEKRDAQKRRERFLVDSEALCQSHDTMGMRAAIAEGEALGFQSEVEVLREALEKVLTQLRARALEFRKEQEKLAPEFRTPKEAQDLGGEILAAQWRAAVAAVQKPFEFSEEVECARLNKQ
jgi:hypothetical protein